MLVGTAPTEDAAWRRLNGASGASGVARQGRGEETMLVGIAPTEDAAWRRLNRAS
jgi:hypothetical protein